MLRGEKGTFLLKMKKGQGGVAWVQDYFWDPDCMAKTGFSGRMVVRHPGIVVGCVYPRDPPPRFSKCMH